MQMSSTHLYHAVSLIRGLLGVGFGPAAVGAGLHRAAGRPAEVRRLDGRRHAEASAPRRWPPSTSAAAWGSTTSPTTSGGTRCGPGASWSAGRWARSSTTASSAWSTRARRWSRTLVRRQTGIDLNLEGFDLDHISFDGRVVYRNPFVGSGMSDDDIAVAAITEATGAWARGEGPEPYPLAEACQDHALALAIEESVRTGIVVQTPAEPWH